MITKFNKNSIQVNAVRKVNPRDLEAGHKFYAAAIHGSRIELDDLAFMVSERCSLRESDVLGVLSALTNLIPQEILKGNVVSLGKLGSFYANAMSTGVDSIDELSPAAVKGWKLIHNPTKEFKKQLRMIDARLTGNSLNSLNVVDPEMQEN